MNSNDFKLLLHESVFEFYMYDRYKKEYLDVSLKRFFDIPYFYFRAVEKPGLFFSRKNIVDRTRAYDLLCENEKKEVEKLRKKISLWTLDFQKYFREHLPHYSFMFPDQVSKYEISNPELISDVCFHQLENFLERDPQNFWGIQALIIYKYSKWEYSFLDKMFMEALSQDPCNPFILARYARYIWSVKYKKVKDDTLWLRAEKCLRKAIYFFVDGQVPTFFYSWLWNTLLVQKKYTDAISQYDITIIENSKLHHKQAEPYIWKAWALLKIKKYQQAHDILKCIEENENINDKKDFRFYKLQAEILYGLGNYKDFQETFLKSIKIFFDRFPFSFVAGIDGVCFAQYKKYIWFQDKVDLEKNIFTLAWMYKEDILERQKFYLDEYRWFPKLCFYYLQVYYKNE